MAPTMSHNIKPLVGHGHGRKKTHAAMYRMGLIFRRVSDEWPDRTCQVILGDTPSMNVPFTTCLHCEYNVKK